MKYKKTFKTINKTKYFLGFDITKEEEKLLDEISKLIGKHCFSLMHLNDTKENVLRNVGICYFDKHNRGWLLGYEKYKGTRAEAFKEIINRLILNDCKELFHFMLPEDYEHLPMEFKTK